MRKLTIAALFVFAVVCFAGANLAFAGDCCPDKCKPNTCTKECKPKCDPCKPKCDPCKPKCKCTCAPCCPGVWVSGWNPCCPPKGPCATICIDECNMCGCNPCCCGPQYRHPYEMCWAGDGMLCDTGCCDAYLPCKTKCVTCKTVCKCVQVCDPCTCCPRVEYVYETICTEVKRPTVIPWWFSGANQYVDEKAPAEEKAE